MAAYSFIKNSIANSTKNSNYMEKGALIRTIRFHILFPVPFSLLS
jgi:hypothetical protein